MLHNKKTFRPHWDGRIIPYAVPPKFRKKSGTFGRYNGLPRQPLLYFQDCSSRANFIRRPSQNRLQPPAGSSLCASCGLLFPFTAFVSSSTYGITRFGYLFSHRRLVYYTTHFPFLQALICFSFDIRRKKRINQRKHGHSDEHSHNSEKSAAHYDGKHCPEGGNSR